MNQHEITERRPLLDASGNLTEPGYAKSLLPVYRRGDIKANKLTTSSISISRDLHCWQMSFSWIPFGAHRSWSFNIGVKAASLADLKYDKSQSMYDNMY